MGGLIFVGSDLTGLVGDTHINRIDATGEGGSAALNLKRGRRFVDGLGLGAKIVNQVSLAAPVLKKEKRSN